MSAETRRQNPATHDALATKFWGLFKSIYDLFKNHRRTLVEKAALLDDMQRFKGQNQSREDTLVEVLFSRLEAVVECYVDEPKTRLTYGVQLLQLVEVLEEHMALSYSAVDYLLLISDMVDSAKEMRQYIWVALVRLENVIRTRVGELNERYPEEED